MLNKKNRIIAAGIAAIAHFIIKTTIEVNGILMSTTVTCLDSHNLITSYLIQKNIMVLDSLSRIIPIYLHQQYNRWHQMENQIENVDGFGKCAIF
jgi:hypothetical protein